MKLNRLMAKNVLVTGATGLLGNQLTQLLLNRGYGVNILSRKAKSGQPGVNYYRWNVEDGTIDKRCIEGVDSVIHLAGEGIAAKPWTNARKERILKSRTESIRLIYKLIGSQPSSRVKTVISASAVGFYGDRADEILTEESPPGSGFMAEICKAWEDAVDEGIALGLRTVKLRTGIVLTAEGGALPVIAQPIKLGLGSYLGSGKQWMPWIHVHDVLNMYLFVLENEQIEGTYNQAAPLPVTNADFTKAVATALKKPLWLPRIPAFVLRVLLGEMKAVVLNSNRTSSEKIESVGFRFKFRSLSMALSDIYDT